MSSQLKAGALLSYVSLGLNNVIGIVYTPYMLRMLGQQEYGLFALVGSIISYLAMLDLGFGNAIIRYTSKFIAEKNADRCHTLWGMFFILYSLIGLVTIGIGTGLYFSIDTFFGETMSPTELDEMRVMFVLMIFNLAITFPFSIFGSIIIAHEKFVFQQLLNLFRIVVHPLIMVLVLMMGYKAVAMIVVMTSVNVFVLLLNCHYCFSKLHIRLNFKHFDFKLLREIFSYSVYMFIAIIVDKLYWSSGQFILGAVSGTVSVAIYAVAIQLKNYYSNFASALTTVLLPRVTSMVTKHESDEEISNLFIRVGRLQFSLMCFIITGFIVFGRSFIECWAGQDYSESYVIALIVMVPFTLPLIQNLGLTILQAKAKLKFRSLLCVSLGVMSFAVSVPLAKEYGGVGCAVGTSICLLIAEGLIMNIYYKTKIGLDVLRFWREILKMLLPIIWVPALFVWFIIYYPISGWLDLSVYVLVYAIIYMPLFWMLSLNSSERQLLEAPFVKIYGMIARRL